MSTDPQTSEPGRRIRDFAAAWLRLGDPGVGAELVADPILVLGPGGASAVPRDAFLAAVAERQARVSSSMAAAVTTLTEATATPLGDRLVLATLSWSFGQGDVAATLVGDFLLDNEGDDRLRCIAYLPRTNVLDHLE